MKPEFDITKTVEEISMQAKETQEEFIFETIHPYCEHILQIKINKEELKQILLNGAKKQQPCEDCISRKELLKLLDSKTVDTNPDHFNFKDKKDYERWVLNNGYNTGLVQARIYVRDLPSVTPLPEPYKESEEK